MSPTCSSITSSPHTDRHARGYTRSTRKNLKTLEGALQIQSQNVGESHRPRANLQPRGGSSRLRIAVPSCSKCGSSRRRRKAGTYKNGGGLYTSFVVHQIVCYRPNTTYVSSCKSILFCFRPCQGRFTRCPRSSAARRQCSPCGTFEGPIHAVSCSSGSKYAQEGGGGDWICTVYEISRSFCTSLITRDAIGMSNWYYT